MRTPQPASNLGSSASHEQGHLIMPGTPFTDADAAALYDVLNPWDGTRYPGDAFYDALVMSAESVLDVGCGTGGMLRHARESGHRGRLTGLDPDLAALARAQQRGDIEWVAGTAPLARWESEFDLATMTSHAFQCLITDAEIAESLAAIRTALRPGGLFAFETRHPQARAWESWTESSVADVLAADGRALRVWHRLDSVEADVVSVSEMTAGSDGTILRTDQARLRFPALATLNQFLVAAGFQIAAQYGDWQRGLVTSASTEIVTLAAR
jgi:SAM-dependent methyltransferase